MGKFQNSKHLSDNKTQNLIFGIAFDAIGMMSYSLPFIGEMSDLAWAPISAFLMTRLYKGNAGKIGGVVSFLEEILPFTDIIPSFTLMWFYTYVFKKPDSV